MGREGGLRSPRSIQEGHEAQHARVSQARAINANTRSEEQSVSLFCCYYDRLSLDKRNWTGVIILQTRAEHRGCEFFFRQVDSGPSFVPWVVLPFSSSSISFHEVDFPFSSLKVLVQENTLIDLYNNLLFSFFFLEQTDSKSMF